MLSLSKLLALVAEVGVVLGLGVAALAGALRDPVALQQAQAGATTVTSPPASADTEDTGEPGASAQLAEPSASPPDWLERWEEGRQRAFDALCARVEALPAQRPFNRLMLRPRPLLTADEELVALRRELLDAEQRLRRDAGKCWQHADDLAERVAVFPWRYGQDPRELDGWAPLRDEARRLVADLEHDPPELTLDTRDSYAALFRAQLLELAGRTAEADEALAQVEIHHFCGNCAGGRQVVVDRRRSEAAERRGDGAAAVQLLKAASSLPYDGWVLDLEHDISLARLGLLELQSGHDAEGLCLLQLLVELRPATPGAELARAALTQVGALREPTAERLQQAWIDGAAAKDACRVRAVRALAALPAGDAFERLAELRRQGDVTALAALADLRDERARPIFESVLLDGELTSAPDALRGLHALEGGARQHLRPLLQRIADAHEPRGASRLRAIDGVLRDVCAGGPLPDGAELTQGPSFARAWLAWLDQQWWGR
jgi:hypothetical protein